MDSVLEIRNKYLKKWMEENAGELGPLQQSKYCQFAQWYNQQKADEAKELFCKSQQTPACKREGDGC